MRPPTGTNDLPNNSYLYMSSNQTSVTPWGEDNIHTGLPETWRISQPSVVFSANRAQDASSPAIEISVADSGSVATRKIAIWATDLDRVYGSADQIPKAALGSSDNSPVLSITSCEETQPAPHGTRDGNRMPGRAAAISDRLA